MYNTNPTQTQQQPIYVPQQYQVNRPIYPTMMQQPYMGLKGRPVASIEEARASIIDFDGSIFYFPDLANNRIYTKQINLDGTASLSVYELRQVPLEPEAPLNEYVTKKEFESVINQLRALVPAQPVAAEPKKPAEKPILNF